jgi:hypothetical protein
MPVKGSALRAKRNPTLRTLCAGCGKSIPTEVGHLARERAVFPTCTACHNAGWRPAGYVATN